MQLGTNHLGHFALTGLLLDRLLASDAPRVVNVSSGAHRFASMRWDDLQFERSYDTWGAYAQSKLANLLFTAELARRAPERLAAVGCHPGYAATNLQAAGPKMSGNRILESAFGVLNRVFAQSADQGSWPTLYAAADPAVGSGDYIGPKGLMEMTGPPTKVRMSRPATDAAQAERLWTLSEELTGVRFDWTPGEAA